MQVLDIRQVWNCHLTLTPEQLIQLKVWPEMGGRICKPEIGLPCQRQECEHCLLCATGRNRTESETG